MVNLGFQSPIRRVSGCNDTGEIREMVNLGFQSPIRRVSGCNISDDISTTVKSCLSVPYTSGQWL